MCFPLCKLVPYADSSWPLHLQFEGDGQGVTDTCGLIPYSRRYPFGHSFDDTDGFLVAPGDANALADTLERAVRHPQRAGMGAAARAEAVDTYSRQRVAARYMEVYAQK